jgi:nitrite reductase (NADH) large subunit
MSEKIIIIGNGMVGHNFCEALIEKNLVAANTITIFGEENRPAYDRVHLSSYFEEEDVDLTLHDDAWYAEQGFKLHLGDPIVSINRETKIVTSGSGITQSYDRLIFATGSSAFMPPLPGIETTGVFAYRTIEDLENITAYAKKSKRVAVIGGGLLGLEAAKACLDLKLETTVIEMAPRLMPRQLDGDGADILLNSINKLGIEVLVGVNTTSVTGEDKVDGIQFKSGIHRPYDMIVVSAGIKPNDSLARECGLETGARGGIVVDGSLKTSDPSIYAIGECALFEEMIYGLIAPGYDMANVVASNIAGESKEFAGADMSTKLKLLGLDVASLGNPFDDNPKNKIVEVLDEVTGIYKKMVVDPTGHKLIGAILVGDADPYGALSLFVKGNKDLPDHPQSLIVKGGHGDGLSLDSLEDEDVICSCNNVTFGAIREAVDSGIYDMPGIKKATTAGTGCGGCLPMVKSILNHQLTQAGIEVDNTLCEHFKYTRQELLHIVKVKKHKTFSEVHKEYGTGNGCEVCKTQIAAMLSATWNDYVLDQDQIQETNDRFLGNIQRNGTYSVIPRSLGGELKPEQLIRMGEVAKKYDLYTKLTGSQRVAMFGAHLDDLPEIWRSLNEVGLESGHAYSKGLRMVKSCVGDSWCRMGVGPSVNFAIELETRYKGMRSPHKVKGGVSGCTRECAEAMCKDFGLIATEHGWNLFVGGNGGTYPRHADLLAKDIDRETATKYIDRFLMYYVRTADKLHRTATWMLNLDGGIETLKEVIIEDSLGICAELEADMQRIVDSQHDEWAVTTNKPEQVKKFHHFANSTEKDPVQNITVRDQTKPVLWKHDYEQPEITPEILEGERSWVKLGTVKDFPIDGGLNFKYGHHQIAVFNFSHRDEWYACQNLCPHKREMVLSRGILGDAKGIPKVACPMHKKSFSLKDGKSMVDDIYSIQTFEVKIDGDSLMVKLPTSENLDRLHICDPEKSCNCFA